MSSATVLDSIIEGVRADVAAREAVVSFDEIKAAAKAARVAAGRDGGAARTRHRCHRRGEARQPVARSPRDDLRSGETCRAHTRTAERASSAC